MNVLVITGGRNFEDTRFVWDRLDLIHEATAIGLFLHGEATGADQFGKMWALARGIPEIGFRAKWRDLEGVPQRYIRQRRDGTRYNVQAGFQRNDEMANFPGLTHGAIFPGNRGTADMAQRLFRTLPPENIWDYRGSLLR